MVGSEWQSPGAEGRKAGVEGEASTEFEAYREAMLGDLALVGPMESTLAERIVSLTWRLKRAERLQNEVFDYLIADEITSSLSNYGDELSDTDVETILSRPDRDPHLAVGRAVYRDYTRREMVVDRLMMYERRTENSLYRTMHELQELKRLREADGGHSPPYESESCETKPMEGVSSVKGGTRSSHLTLPKINRMGNKLPILPPSPRRRFRRREPKAGRAKQSQFLLSNTMGPRPPGRDDGLVRNKATFPV